MLRVYISHPITKGDGCDNFYECCKAQQKLMDAGFAVLNPGLSMMHPNAKNIHWQTWIDSDLKWVEVSDVVIRLPGESKGADIETAHAREKGIPVVQVTCLAGLEEWIVGQAEPQGVT